MSWANIPFTRPNAELILNGLKSCTTRHHARAKTGDFFKVGTATYVVTRVEGHTLGWVAEHLHREEGFADPQGFIDCWNGIAADMAAKWGDQSKFAPFEESCPVWTHHFVPLDVWESRPRVWF